MFRVIVNRTQQCPCWPFWSTASLLPIAQRTQRYIDTLRKSFLGKPGCLAYGPDPHGIYLELA